MSGKHRKPEPALDPVAEPVAEPVPAPPPGLPPPARPAAPTVTRTVTPTITPRGSRRARAADRARRRAETRRKVLLAGGAALALVAVLVGVLVLASGDEDGAPPAAPGATGRQQTLLVLVTGADGVSQASALTGVVVEEDAADMVLVPSGLLVDVAGTGTVPFGETTTLPEQTAPAQALTDLVGVRVDDSWRLTAEGLAGLVDAVGGVRATVDRDVPTTDAEGNQTLVVSAGAQELRGRAAAAYATFRAEGEPEQARLARFDDVWSGLLDALPTDPLAVQAILESLGKGSATTATPRGLATRLTQLARAAAAGELVSDVLPVTEIDTGGDVPTYGIDSGQVGAMMRARFPGALQADRDGEVLRVLVENGVGTPGLVEAAREKLVGAGFRFVNGGNAAEFTDEPSSVIVPDGTEQSVRRGERVAAALGLPDSAIATSDRGQTVADVIVILGSDFTP